MKPDIHPEYRPVVFRDTSTGFQFLTRSTRSSDETVMHEGVERPVIDVEISSNSHPWWTGRARTLDTEGRVQKFERRYGKGAGK